MSITIYKDHLANAIFIEDANGVQFLNSIQATVDNGFCSLFDLAKSIEIVTSLDYTEFVDESGQGYGNNAVEVCDALNAIFRTSGTPLANPPVITSPLSVTIVQGETLNYELQADYGVGYEWDLSSLTGVVTVEGNIRKLIGGSNLAAGTYNIPVKAINYNGEDNQTIVLTVDNPSFANTKSVQFNKNDWIGGDPSLVDEFERAGNGSGNADAWSISLYFKAGTSDNGIQTILYYGAEDTTNGHGVHLYWSGNDPTKGQLVLRYGSNYNKLILKTPVNSIQNNSQWYHILVTYDGGTTGSGSNEVAQYYSRFKMFINGVEQTTNNINTNYGITSGLTGETFRLGRYSTGSGYLRNSCKIDELAVWGSDQSGNISDIYNSGMPFDLTSLQAVPSHWWRMGDEDVYPYLQDRGTQANCTLQMYNMTSSDIVSDTPTLVLNITPDQYIVSSSNNGQLLNMLHPTGWTVLLPPLSTVPLGFSITVKSIASATNTGTIATYSNETIDGSDDMFANGRIELTLTKQSDTSWVSSNLIQHSTYIPPSTVSGGIMTINDIYHAYPVNRVIDFTSVDTIVLNHNTGTIPIIHVWVEDGIGGYTDASVDIDHDWATMLTSTVNLGQIETGKLIYTFNA